MKKGMIIAIVVALIMITAGVAIIATQDIRSLSDISTVDLEEKVFDVTDGFSDIYISDIEHDIRFMVSSDNKCYVKTRDSENMYHTVTVEDNALRVILYDTRKWYDYIGISFSTPTITVYLPREKYSSLSICGSTGSVEIPKDFAFEIVDVVVSTGDVTCLASAESICISANTGDLLVENVTTGSIQLSTSTGKVSLLGAECSGDVTVNVSTGKVFLTDVTCNDFSSKGSAGDISLKNVIVLEKLFIERDTGDVRFDCCDAEEIFVITDTGDVKGSLLTEKVFLVMTDTGIVDVPKTVDGGKCEITTDTGNIKITVN